MLEVLREAAVRDDVHLVDLLDLADPLEDPVDHRLAAHGQEALREVVGERLEPRRVAAREDDRLHENRCSLTASRPSSGPHWCAIPRAVQQRFDAELQRLLERRIAGREHADERIGEEPLLPALQPLQLSQRLAQLIVKRRQPPLRGEEQPDETETRVSSLHPPAELVAAAPGLQGAEEAVEVAVVELVEVLPGAELRRSRRSPRRARRPRPSVSATISAVTYIGV